jgi:hypothetical protein
MTSFDYERLLRDGTTVGGFSNTLRKRSKMLSQDLIGVPFDAGLPHHFMQI